MGRLYRQAGRSHWQLKYYRDGQVIFESARTADRAAAKRLLRQRETAIDRGEPVHLEARRVRFDEAARDLLTDYQIQGYRSRREIEGRIRLHLAPVFGGRPLAKITTTAIRAYTQARHAEGAANATINRELAALKRMFSLAIQARRISHRPYIPMLREDNARRGFFEPDAFAALLPHLSPAVQPVIRFAYVTGWRIQSEVLPLEWRQVDFMGGDIRLDPGTTKNRDGRVFQMTTTLRALLVSQRAATDRVQRDGTICPWVFHRRGRPIRSFRGESRRACAAAGLPGRIPHDLRRTAIRNMVRGGMPERLAMRLSGHRTRAVFDRYDIVSDRDLRTAATLLDAYSDGEGKA